VVASVVANGADDDPASRLWSAGCRSEAKHGSGGNKRSERPRTPLIFILNRQGRPRHGTEPKRPIDSGNEGSSKNYYEGGMLVK
jgi:hypothetical protein